MPLCLVKNFHLTILLCALGVFWTQVTLAQETRGTLLGRIVDPSGAVIVGANIEALNPSTGVRTAAASNTSGDFLLPFLTPGPYTLTVEAAGFKRVVRQGITVRVNDRITIDFSMELGGTAETVQVTAETPLLDTSTSSVGTVVDNKSIQELPLHHGMVLMMANFAPGVTVLNGNANYTRPFDTSGPTNIAVSGSRIGTNQFLVDGAPNMQRGEIAYAPPPGVVSEFKIQTSTFDAASGYTTGAVVNMSLASGANDVHGQLSYFLQNPALNANRYFLNSIGAPQYSFREHRWGATASGPIKIPKLYDGRNKTFWLYGYEAVWTFDPAAFSTQTVPTPAQTQGDFSSLLAINPQYQIYDPYSTVPAGNGLFRRTPLAGNIIPQNLISPLGRRIASLYDPGNQPGGPDGVANLNFPSNAQDYYWNHIGKVDHNVSDRQRLFVRFNYTMLDRPWQIGHQSAVGSLFQRRNRGAAFDDVITLSPSLILNFRYNYTRFIFTAISLQTGWDLEGLGFSRTFVDQIRSVDPEGIRLPQIQIAGYQTLSNTSNNARVNDTHDFGVSFTKTTGTHTIRFGGGQRIFKENSYDKSNSSGLLTFGTDWTKGPNSTSGSSAIGQGLASLLYGLPTGGSFPIVDDYAEQTSTWSMYLQDDWKVTPKLTLNFGFRYELPSSLTERFDRSVLGFDSSAASPIEAQVLANYAQNPIAQIPAGQFSVKGGLTFAGVNGAPRHLWNQSRKNIMPRTGLAYSFNSKTVFRAGYGIYFEPLGVNSLHVIQTGFSRSTDLVPSVDNGQNFIATIANPFPGGLVAPLGSAGGLATNLGQGVSFFDQNMANPYTQRWQASLQREMPWRSVLEVSYVGNRTVRDLVQRDLNALPNQYLSTSPTRDQATINFLNAQVPNPFYPLLPKTSLSNTTVARNQLLRPYPQFTNVSMNTNQGYSYYHAFQAHVEKRLSAGFTSTVSYTWSKMMDALSYRNAGDPMPEKVISAQDRTHRVTITGIYQLPFGKSNTRLSKFTGGWQVQAIYAGQSGPPLGFGNAIFIGDLDSIGLPRSEQHADRWFNTAGFERNATRQLASNLQTMSTRFTGIRGDGMNNIDFSLLKDTFIKERLRLQFRAEAINLANHPQFNAPNTTPTSTAFARVTTEQSVPRVLQFGLKLLF